jgi:hypothetical protein
MIDGQAPMSTGSAPAEAPAPTVESIAGLFEAEILAERNPPKEVEAPADTVETEETVSDDAADAPETDETAGDELVEAESDQDGEPDEAPAIQAIDAPPGMSEADKAEFAKLPPSQKAWIAKRIADQTADYTRKTQDVAERRKAVDGMAQEVMGKLQSYDAILTKFTDARIEPPDPQLRLTDPEAYDQALAEFVHRRDLREKAAAERGRVQQEFAKAQEVQQQAYFRAEAEKLAELAPELAAETPAAQKARKDIYGFAQKLGYSPDQLKMASALDMVTLHKAMLFDAQQAARKAVKVAPKAPPKVIKPGSASAGGKPSQLSSAVQVLKQNPSVDALASAYEAELKAERRR